jgi:hypothetical protein
MVNKSPNGIDSGLPFRAIGGIVPIEVLVEYVHTVMAMVNPIRVKHRDDLDHKHLPNKGSPNILGYQKLDQPLHDKTRGCLSRMHAGSDQNYRLFEREGLVRLGEEVGIGYLLGGAVCLTVCYCEEVDLAVLGGQD